MSNNLSNLYMGLLGNAQKRLEVQIDSTVNDACRLITLSNLILGGQAKLSNDNDKLVLINDMHLTVLSLNYAISNQGKISYPNMLLVVQCRDALQEEIKRWEQHV